MVAVTDSAGKKLLTNLKTSTVMKRTSVLTMRKDPEVIESSIADLLTIDMFLGLVGKEEDFNASLVQNLDVTRQRSQINMRRDISSTASNVMTVLVQGDATTFDESYATNYTLAVEDIITLHFLSQDKLNQVKSLMDAGTAFTQMRGPASDLSTMQLVPTDALLQLCPLQAIVGRYGCLTRREVHQRRIDFMATSIVNIAPNNASNAEELHNVSTKAGQWARNLLGNTDFATELGYNHSAIMNARYKLNARYRRGFLITPTTPWRQREMDREGITSPLDLSQITITTMLLSVDANISRSYVSTVAGGVAGSNTRRLLSTSAPSSRSRMLLQFNSDSGDNVDEEAKKHSAPTTTHEITSVHDNENVVQAVCTDSPVEHQCTMIRFSKSVSIPDFCQNEETIIGQMQPDINYALQSASDNAIHAIHITSVAQTNRAHVCSPSMRRRMLATSEELIFTLVLEVAEVRDRYRFNQTYLASERITSVTMLTNTTYWQLCGGSASAEDCAQTIAQNQNVKRDVVLHFSLHNPPSSAFFDRNVFVNIVTAAYGSTATATMSTPIHVSGDSTQFHVTVSVPFLQVTSEAQVNVAKTNLVASGFVLEDTIQHDVILDMLHSDVTTNVQDKVQALTAQLYNVVAGKIHLSVRPNTYTAQTKVTLLVKVLSVASDPGVLTEYSIRQNKIAMAEKLDKLLVIEMYKISPTVNSQESTSSSGSNNVIVLYLLLGFLFCLLIAVMCIAKHKLESSKPYSAMYSGPNVPVAVPTKLVDETMSTSRSDPYGYVDPYWQTYH